MSAVRHVQSPFMQGQTSLPSTRRSRIELALALLVGAVFIYAGVLKVLDPVKFASDIANFRILPWAVCTRVAFYLPWLEIICGVALIAGRLRDGALGILSVLTVIFIVATISAKVRGINLDCGCFGSATKNLTFTWHLVINFALLGTLLVLWFWPTQRRH